jgi:hypothetical protein
MQNLSILRAASVAAAFLTTATSGPCAENAPAPAASAASAAVQPGAPSKPFSPAVEQVLKLQRGGVDEAVILNYVENSRDRYPLTAEEIIQLKQLGVAAPVLSAMIQHTTPANGVAAPPETSQPAPASQPAAAPVTVAPTYVQGAQVPYYNTTPAPNTVLYASTPAPATVVYDAPPYYYVPPAWSFGFGSTVIYSGYRSYPWWWSHPVHSVPCQTYYPHYAHTLAARPVVTVGASYRSYARPQAAAYGHPAGRASGFHGRR